MASTRDPEDTLPLNSPLTQKPGFEDREIAIYTTLPLQTSQLQQLEQDLRDADDILSTDVAHLAPQPHFNTVFDIYNHHVNIATRRLLTSRPKLLPRRRPRKLERQRPAFRQFGSRHGTAGFFRRGVSL